MNVGELLDRAISIYVRGFVPLFVMFAVTAIPAALLQNTATAAFGHLSDSLISMGRLPSNSTRELDRLMRDSMSGFSGWPSVAVFVAPVVLNVLSVAACISFVSARVDGRRLSALSALWTGFCKWVVLLAIWFGCAVVLLTGAVIAVAGLYVLVAAYIWIFGTGHTDGPVICMMVVIASIYFVAFSAAIVALQMAAVRIVERQPPLRALGWAFRRTLHPALFWRSTGVALGYMAMISMVSTILWSFGGLLLNVSVIPEVIASTGQIILNGIATVFMVMYVRDIRVRTEGVDLLLAARSEGRMRSGDSITADANAVGP